ncbi:MAG: nuclear transport factor 2 family protein [Acidimicrobiales bacterium]
MATDPSTDSTSTQEEIRRLHDDWFAASHRKDLDASMAPIDEVIVSYEHTVPLQYTSLDDIREECRRGFDLAGDDFMWTVPDLRVVADGDLAVAWGLNRMTDRLPDGSESTTWSRGTRVFRRSDGRWTMIHQHVSFPFDPETGHAATGLTP